MKMKYETVTKPKQIVGYALAIQQVTKTLETKIDAILKEEQLKGSKEGDDALYLPGLVVSTVILTALSAELILKAWIGRTTGQYPKTHDLEVLVNGVDGSAWSRFSAQERRLIDSTLANHSKDFTHWRYLFEDLDASDTTKHPDPAMVCTVELLIGRYLDKTCEQKTKRHSL